MKKRIIIAIALVSLAALSILLNFTDPSTADPVVILGVFISGYLFLVSLLTFVIVFSSKIVNRLSFAVIAKRPAPVLSLKKSYYYSTVLAVAPLILISLQSIGAIGIYEVILALLFIGLGLVYVAKKTD